MSKAKALAAHRKAVKYLTTPTIGDGLPPGASDQQREKIRKALIDADPTERMRIDLEVAKAWYEEMQIQHTNILARRADLIPTAQASTIQHITIAMGISADKVDLAAKRIDELEARLGEGEVVQPLRVIRGKSGKTVEG